MKKLTLLFAAVLFISTVLKAQATGDISIPYQKFVLDNGLTLIVHEDHKAPIVAVNVWYHVGSKNEKKGKTGFAHLFEHLMFNGSENFNDDYFKAMEKVGATDLNGTTNKDRTNYFENVPVNAFDVALFMESDRMGHLIGAIDQGKLDEQRGVVQNEKRQGENQPYGRKINWAISENTYPEGHPYHWETIGYMEDLNAASLQDVHEWFKNSYGAANAVLVIAGDVNTQDALERVKKYFGDIPPGPPVLKQNTWVAKMTGTHRMQMEDRVPQARIYKVWNVPEWGNKELTYLQLAASILSSGKTSRLYKRLVYDEQIATDASAYTYDFEIGSQFRIVSTAKQGVELSRVEKAIDEELARLLKEGPTQKELDRVRTEYIADFVRGIERIGGFGGKSDILAQGEVYRGNPDYYKEELDVIKKATAADIKNACQKWLSDGQFILDVQPYVQFKAAASGVDRSKLPETGTPPSAKFPDIQKFTLSNGLNVMLAQRNTVPVVELELLFNAGYAADSPEKAGLASLVSNMLDEGTKTRSSLEISEESQSLGAQIGSYSAMDYSAFSLNSLKQNLDKSLALYADVLLNPSFPQKELDRLKQERLAGIKREKSNPNAAASRVLPMAVFGKGHAYGNPMSGSGFEQTVSSITRDDIVDFHSKWFRPNNATLVIVGDISAEEIKPRLEKLFGTWKQAAVPSKNVASVAQKAKPVIYLIDRPAAEQSVIYAGHIMDAVSANDEVAIEGMNTVLGGSFTSRINMNLRENKHWSYGSRSFVMNTRGQRLFGVSTSVQSDKTKESVQEIYKELSGILKDNKVTDEELNKVRLGASLELPGLWETNGAIMNSVSSIVLYGYPENYYQTYAAKVNELNKEKLQSAADKVLRPENVVWVIVGDRAKVEPGLKELGYEINIVDADGKSN